MIDNSKLDLLTLMKASQSITDEIVLKNLIDNILYLMVENAGAQQGLFVLKQNDKWHIAAQMDCNKKLIKRDTALSIEDPAEEMPVSLINYIARCGERVVLGDAANEGQFVQDPYIVAYKPLSILCMPLKYKTHISCILYLEHNLIRDAFTLERLEKITLLSSQAAISIENARLYNDLQESEKKYRKIFEDCKEMIFITNIGGKFLDVNPAFETQTGYTLEELLKLNAQDIYANQKKHTLFEEEIAKHGSVHEYGLKIFCKDRRVIDVLVSATACQSEEGSTLGYHGIIRDITVEKQLEPDQLLAFEFQKLKDTTEHANSTNSAIISNMSHELRSPLNSIIGFTQLLSRSSNLTEEQKDDLTTINRSGNHLLGLINYILDLTKIETGKQAINYSQAYEETVEFIYRSVTYIEF